MQLKDAKANLAGVSELLDDADRRIAKLELVVIQHRNEARLAVQQLGKSSEAIAKLEKQLDAEVDLGKARNQLLASTTQERDAALANAETLKGCVERLQAQLDELKKKDDPYPRTSYAGLVEQLRTATAENRRLHGEMRSAQNTATSAVENYRRLKAAGVGPGTNRQLKRLRARLAGYVPLLTACRSLAVKASKGNAPSLEPELGGVMDAFRIAVATDPRGMVDSAQVEDQDPKHWIEKLVDRLVDAVQPRPDTLAAERDAYKRDHLAACQTIADMHAAAVGEVRGPINGVVEDVASVRGRMLHAESLLRDAAERCKHYLDTERSLRDQLKTKDDMQRQVESGQAQHVKLLEDRIAEVCRLIRCETWVGPATPQTDPGSSSLEMLQLTESVLAELARLRAKTPSDSRTVELVDIDHTSMGSARWHCIEGKWVLRFPQRYVRTPIDQVLQRATVNELGEATDRGRLSALQDLFGALGWDKVSNYTEEEWLRGLEHVRSIIEALNDLAMEVDYGRRKTDQPTPKHDPTKPDVWQEVIGYAEHHGYPLILTNMMRARRELGIQRYGTPLQPYNGRDVKRDMREELLDATVYAAQYALENVGGGTPGSVLTLGVSGKLFRQILALTHIAVSIDQ